MEIQRLVKPWGMVFATLLLVACQRETEPQSQPLQADSQWVQGQLENGMQYHLRSVNDEKVSLRLLVHTGAVNETAAQAGYAHFLEHMALLGGESFGAERVEAMFEEAGVSFGNDLNAFTSHETTHYQIDLPNNKKIESAITWLSDIATGKLTLDPALIENEKGAVLGEFRFAQLEDKSADQKLFEALLEGSDYEGREVLGTQENIKKIDRASLLAFYKANYLPEKTELIISGDIDRIQLEPMIAKSFSSGLNTAGKPESTASNWGEKTIAPLNTEPMFVSGSAGQHPALALLTELSDRKMTTESDYQTMLMEQTVIQAIAERLNDRRMETQAPLLNIFVDRSLIINRYIGYIVAEFTESDRLAAQKFMAKELASLRDHGVSSVELTTIRQTWQNDINNLDTNWQNKNAIDYAEDRLYSLIDGYTLMDKEAIRHQLQQFVKRLSKKQLNQAIKDYLTSDFKPVFGYTREGNAQPAKDSYSLFREQFAASGEILVVSSASVDAFPEPERGGDISSYTAVEPTLHRWMLANGIEVWLKQMPEAGENVFIYLMSSGGLAALPPELHHAGDMTNAVFARSGLAGISVADFDKLLQRHDMYLEPVVWPTSHGLYSEAAKGELPFAFSVLYQAMTAAKVDESQFYAVQKELALKQDNWLASPQGKFINRFVGSLFPSESPYLVMTGADYQKVEPEQVQAVVDLLLKKNRNFKLVVSADIPAEEFATMIKRYFGGISMEPAVPVTDYKSNPKVSIASLEVQEAVDNTVNYLYSLMSEGQPKTTKDRFTADLVYRLLNKRYRDTLRNAQGLSYSPYVNLTWFDGSGQAIVEFNINASPDKLEAVRKGTSQVLNEARKGFTEEEFKIVKSQLASDLKSGLTNAHEQARMLSSYVLFDADPLAVVHPDKVLSSLTLDEVNAMAQRLIGGETQQMEGVLSPKVEEKVGS
ncbi:M16 family metallopeptidase [Photobacterium sp. J15]|uniref:M16 family metallopeptidase n=1 Tax=Photobacterium sp. J15 TaxID=265901 RepID=UPI0007E4130D|nr:M16 family metallopeptidase [Photobacterium sp. J15]